MSSRCDNNFIQTFSDRISSFQLQLQDGSTKDQQTWKDLLIQFRNNQLEFYQQLTRMVDYDVETISQIHGPLGEILAKTKEIETAFRTSQTAPSAVKALRSIASAFRAGDEESAMRDFGRNIPDGNGSIAGTVFGCMWDLLAASRVAPFHEFGREAFYGRHPKCVPTAEQRACAIELAMLKVVAGNPSSAEFAQLPYRMKEALYKLLAQSSGLVFENPQAEMDWARKCFSGEQQIDPRTKSECLSAYTKTLEENYMRTTEREQIQILKADLKEALENKAIVAPSETIEAELLETLGHTHQVVFQKLNGLHRLVSSKEMELAGLKIASANNVDSVTSMGQTLNQKQTELSSLRITYTTKEQELHLVQQDLSKKEKEISGLKITCLTQGQQLERMQESLIQAETEVDSLRVKSASNEQELITLRHSMQLKETELHSWSVTCATSKKALLTLEQTVRDNESELTKRKADCFTRDATIGDLSSQLERLKAENMDLKSMLRVEANNAEETLLAGLEESALMQRFATYMNTYSPNHDVKEVFSLICRGKATLKAILDGRAALISLDKRKEEMVPLVWYMVFFAVSKNQGFDQGTIVFRDPKHAIVQFFIDSGAPDVYARASSHFNERILPSTYEGNQITTTFGIDVLGLPGDKQTVNFAPLQMIDGSDWSFFKPENWGLGDWFQYGMHAWDFVATRPAHLMGTANGHDDRKEHVLPEIKKEFKEIFYAMTKSTQFLEEEYGVAAMYRFCQLNIGTCENAETKARTQAFIEGLQRRYDYLETRNGHEAILGDSFIGGQIPDLKK